MKTTIKDIGIMDFDFDTDFEGPNGNSSESDTCSYTSAEDIYSDNAVISVELHEDPSPPCKYDQEQLSPHKNRRSHEFPMHNKLDHCSISLSILGTSDTTEKDSKSAESSIDIDFITQYKPTLNFCPNMRSFLVYPIAPDLTSARQRNERLRTVLEKQYPNSVTGPTLEKPKSKTNSKTSQQSVHLGEPRSVHNHHPRPPSHYHESVGNSIFQKPIPRISLKPVIDSPGHKTTKLHPHPHPGTHGTSIQSVNHLSSHTLLVPDPHGSHGSNSSDSLRSPVTSEEKLKSKISKNSQPDEENENRNAWEKFLHNLNRQKRDCWISTHNKWTSLRTRIEESERINFVVFILLVVLGIIVALCIIIFPIVFLAI